MSYVGLSCSMPENTVPPLRLFVLWGYVSLTDFSFLEGNKLAYSYG